MSYTFGPQPAVDITTAMLVTQAGLVGTVHPTRADAEAGTNALTVVLAGEISTTSVPVSSLGQTVEFTHPDYFRVWWRSGVYISDLMSFDGIVEVVDSVPPALAAFEESIAGVVRSVDGNLPDETGNAVSSGTGGTGGTTWGTLGDKPSTFPPSAHTHVRSDISDISTLARAFLADADAQAMRTRIGAGTGNGTSNLTLGTTSTTAAPGNHAHSQYVDSAQARTIADEQIALNGGTGGAGGVLPWVYRSGAYPTLPATAPAGVQIVMAIGPLQPSVLPSWIGNGPAQVPATYEYNGGLS